MKVKYLKDFQYFLENKYNTYTGEEVADFVIDITPDSHDIPDYFIEKYIKPNDDWVLKDIDLNDLLKDEYFKEYYDSGEDRYKGEEMNIDDLNNELVVYKGKLLDGYSRATKLLKMGEKSTKAFVLY